MDKQIYLRIHVIVSRVSVTILAVQKQ